MRTSKYRTYLSLIFLVLLMIILPNYVFKSDLKRIETSRHVAIKFLGLVDDGRYQQVWNNCAAYLQAHVPLSQWKQQLGDARQAAGEIIERSETQYSYTPAGKEGLPDGEYMVYAYLSKFSAREQVREMVTLHKGQDDTWRVAGYYIE